MSEDLVIQKLLDHDQKFDQMLTKTDFQVFLDDYYKGQDEIMKILMRLDQEAAFSNERFKRIDKRLDTNEEKTTNTEKRVDKIELQFQPT